MEMATLTDKHKEELINKRGLSEQTIKLFGFGSGGPHLLSFEEEFVKIMESGGVREQDLVLSGVFIHDGKRVRVNPILLREENTIGDKKVSNILIPYRNFEGEVYYVRPHKLGFSGLPSEVFQEWNLRDKPYEIILTEGEFKAVAAVQYGFPTISIPGISSFSENKFPDLSKKLKAYDVKRIVILFDNETKDDPNITERYKANPNNRYDTQFYAYYMASRLEKEGAFEVVIATLPDGWKENGKIDIDGAAAQLRTQGEMKKIVYDAVPRNDYLRELSSEAKQMVLRKQSQKHHRSKIHKQFNRYIVTKQTNKGSFDIAISNFVMRVVATHDTPEGVKREIELVNEFGRHSSPFTISSEAMASGDAFRTFVLNKGDFIWRGNTDDLLTIWESEFLMMDEGRFIIESDHIGWLDREKIWLFGNVAVKEDGSEIRPDKNNIFWLDKKGIKPIPLSAKGGIMEGMPYMHLGSGFDIVEFKKRMSEIIGENESNLIIGWITSVLFMEEIFAVYRSFPFLFVTGRWQSGKSTIAEWVMNFFGIENSAKAISQTTPVAIQRSLAYYSCLPFGLDEYRNTKDIAYKNGFLRNVYNRQSAGKGVKESEHGLREAKVRGTLIISGEETPKDGALLSRCIVIFISRAKRLVNNFSWMMAHRTNFSAHVYGVLKKKHSITSRFMQSMEEWKTYFIKADVNDRTAINYATVMAGYTLAFGDDLTFAEWISKETKTVQSEHGEEQAISVFLEDLGVLKTRKLIDENYWVVDNNKIYLYFHGLMQIWAQEFRKTRGEEAFKEGSIRAYLREEDGFLSANTPYRIKGQVKKCVVFDVLKCSEEIKRIVDEQGAMV